MTFMHHCQAALLLAVLTLGGCATQPAPFPHEAANGLKAGPGLLSGERGMFIIFGEPEEVVSPKGPKETENEKRSGDSAGEE